MCDDPDGGQARDTAGITGDEVTEGREKQKARQIDKQQKPAVNVTV